MKNNPEPKKNMNPKIVFKLFSIITLVSFLSCERDWNNPWDEFNTHSPEEWAPQNLQITDVSITEKKLTWTYDGDSRIEGFKIDRKKGDEPWQVAYQIFPKETREWSDAEIIPDPSLTYEYRLYSFAGKNSSGGQTVPSLVNFAAPTNMQTEKLSDNSYKLTWTDNSTGEQGFKIDRKIDENAWITAFAKVPDNQTTFTDTNVFRATNVEYRVYGFYEGYESGKSSITTSAEITAPTNLVISQSSISYITLTWQDNSNGEDGFRIERKYEEGDWEFLTTTKYNLFEDNNFQLNTQVYYRICAYFGQYNSTWAEKDFNSQIPAPSNLQITPNSITSVTLNWLDNSNGEEGFKIDRKLNSGAWEIEFATVGSNQFSFTDNEVDWLQNNYYYRVYSHFGEYNSGTVENAISCPEVTTNAASNVTYNSAISGGSVTIQGNYSISARGICFGTSPNPDIFGPHTTDGSGAGSFSSNLTGLIPVTAYNMRAYATTSWGTSYGPHMNFTTLVSPWQCGTTFTDSRDNNDYFTVQIGNQCWMKENLAYLPSVSPSANGSQNSPYYYVYGYQGTNVTTAKATANYQTYGVLYNWPASLTACPVGWHLPSDAEWTILTDYLGGESVAGGEMKETGTTHWQSPNTGATNSSGFTGLPGGDRDGSGSFGYIFQQSYTWSSSEYTIPNSLARRLSYNNANIIRNSYNKSYGFNVRCLRD